MLNDAVAIVLFKTVVRLGERGIASMTAGDVFGAIGSFCAIFVGSVLIGVIGGGECFDLVAILACMRSRSAPAPLAWEIVERSRSALAPLVWKTIEHHLPHLTLVFVLEQGSLRSFSKSPTCAAACMQILRQLRSCLFSSASHTPHF